MVYSDIIVEMPENCKAKKTSKNSKKQYVYLYLGTKREKGYKFPKPELLQIGTYIESNKMHPNENYYKHFKKEIPNIIVLDTSKPHKVVDYGPYFFLNKVIKDLKIDEVCSYLLDEGTSNTLLSMAMYLLNDSVIKNMDVWCRKNYHYLDKPLSSQRASEYFEQIQEYAEQWQKDWLYYVNENEGVAIDSTSISSYSENIAFLEWGHSKEDNNLAQINFMMVIGKESKLPLCYQIIPGSITDKVSFYKAKEHFGNLGLDINRYTFDKGFYSKDNLIIMGNENKFICPVHDTFELLRNSLSSYTDGLQRSINVVDTMSWKAEDNDTLYAIAIPYKYEEDDLKDIKYNVHLFYSTIRGSIERANLLKKVKEEEGFIRDLSCKDHLTKTDLKYLSSIIYFNVELETYNDVTEIKSYEKKHNLIDEKTSKMGYFAFITNDLTVTPNEAIEWYATRNEVEVAFNELKNNLNFKRLGTHNQLTTNGKLFVGFISLIIKMKINQLLNQYRTKYSQSTPSGKKQMSNFGNKASLDLIRELSLITIQEVDNGRYWLNTEVNKKCKEILSMVGLSKDDLEASIQSLHLYNDSVYN